MDSARCAGLPQAEPEAEREKLKQMPGMPVAPPEKCLGCKDPWLDAGMQCQPSWEGFEGEFLWTKGPCGA